MTWPSPTFRLRRHALIVLAALPLALIGCERTPTRARVIVVGVDGLDPDAVELLATDGSLPNLADIRRTGASGRVRPDEGSCAARWTTVATGRPAGVHGVGAAGVAAPTSRDRHVKAVWNVFSEARRRVAVIGWWATWPAETVRGAIVSDHACYHFRDPDAPRGGLGTLSTIYPPELQAEVLRMFRRPGDLTLPEAAAFVRVRNAEFRRPFDPDDDLSHFKWALAAAKSHGNVGLHLWQRDQPDLLLVYVEALKVTAELFGHLFRGTEKNGRESEQFGNAVEAMYHYVDRLVGEFRQAMDHRTTLVVVSDRGFPLGTRRPANGQERTRGTEGVLYLNGWRVRPGATLGPVDPLDIVPTVLALADLPSADDMPGRVLAEGLVLEGRKPTVPTYEQSASRAPR